MEPYTNIMVFIVANIRTVEQQALCLEPVRE